VSIKLMSLIWEENNGFLNGIEKAILIRLADFGSDNGKDIFPGKNRLTLDTGFSISTVKRTLSDLEAKKIITITTRKENDKNITNLYSIDVELLKKLAELKTVDKSKVGGSDRTQGRVTVNPGGRVRVNPDPLHNNHYINNNSKPKIKSVDKSQTISSEKESSVVVILDKELEALKLCEQDRVNIIRDYDVDKIKKVIRRARSPNINNPAGYVKSALIGDWDFEDREEGNRISMSVSPYPSPEETTAMLNSRGY
jgi:DNA-binding PadR family transcriptional regulator